MIPVWAWFFIAAAIVAIAGLAIVIGRAAIGRRRTRRLQERFGPEYERTVAQLGDQGAAENELAARARKRDKLDIVALSPEARNRYAVTWQRLQTAFVDDPSGAVGDADSLVTDVMRDRGYPIDDVDRRAADISVDHPAVVENYRTAHTIYLSQERGRVATEDHRKAFVHYRALFETLLHSDNHVKTDEDKADTDGKDKDEPKGARA